MKPPKLLKAYVNNFSTLKGADSDGNLALVSAIRKADKKPVALVCAMSKNEDGTITPIPLAVMCEGNPFEDFEDPTVL
jgi:hypothetical protein